MKMKGISMTSSCKWPITCTSKDKYGNLFIFFFRQAWNSCRFKELTCPFTACLRLILVCPACQNIWIWPARHAGDFGTRGMLGMNFSLEPRLLATRVRRSRKFKICLQGMQISVACRFKCKNTLGPPPLLPVSKSLAIGKGKILEC